MEEKQNAGESSSATVAEEERQRPVVEKPEASAAGQESSASALRARRSVKSRFSPTGGTQREIRDTRSGRGSKSGPPHEQNHKRKSPESDSRLGNEWRANNVTHARASKEVAQGDNERISEIRRADESTELEANRVTKRIKLKSSIISSSDQGTGGDPEDTRSRRERLQGNSSREKIRHKVDAEERYRGTAGAHQPSSDLDRHKDGRVPPTKRGLNEKTRSGVQHSRHAAGGEQSGSLQRARLDARQITRLVGRGRNGTPPFASEDGYRRSAGKRGGDHEAEDVEDSRTRKDVAIRSNDVADKTAERPMKSRVMDNKDSAADDHTTMAEERSSLRERLDRSRAEESQELLDNDFGKHSLRESDRRVYGRDLRQKLDFKNRLRVEQRREGKNLSKHREVGRNVQVRQLARGTSGPHSRNEGFHNGNVGYRGNSVAHIYTQIKRRAGHGSDDGRRRDENGPKRRGVNRFGGGVDNDIGSSRDQRRSVKASVKERLGERSSRGANERIDLFMRNPHDHKSGRENPDHRSEAYEALEGQGVVTGARGVGHELESEINGSTAFEVGGFTRRFSSKIVAPSQQDSEDEASDSDNHRKEVRRSVDTEKEPAVVQEKGGADKQERNEKSVDEQMVDVVREDNEDPGQTAKDIRHREDAAESNKSPQTERRSPNAHKLRDSEPGNDRRRNEKDEKRYLTGRTTIEIRSRLPRGRDRRGSFQASKRIEERKIDYRRRHGSGKQQLHHHDRDLHGKVDKVRSRVADARESKRPRVSRERIEKSKEPLSRRRDNSFNSREKEDEQKRERRLSRSPRPASLNRRKGRASPSRDHGRASSSIRSERDPKEDEKSERDRHLNLALLDSRYRRFGGGTSGLGGYSPRRRRSDAAIKTPSPPSRSPDRRRQQTWDAIPPGIDSTMMATISAVHQAAVQQALVTLATTVAPLGSATANMMVSPGTTPAPATTGLQTVSSVIQSLLPHVNPAVTAVTLTQATRPFRRLYVGNVPATVSDGELLEFMNAAMLSANANHLPGTKPCINCSVNAEKGHAFAEFITPEDATAALAFDGVTLHGTTLKIRRPKDFALPPVTSDEMTQSSAGIEGTAGIPDMVSSCVLDSPNKVFVGGIPASVTADKVKELVTAFGQLKAYHWEVDLKTQPVRAYAFLEYMDPAAMPSACAGLNGMRLGTGFLTVVQATPDADPETARIIEPFYGVPEHAKCLLESPSRVLELNNLVLAEDVSNLTKGDIEELIEDVRVECSRFGNVKSAHMVQSCAQTVVKDQFANFGVPESLGIASVVDVHVDYSSSLQEEDHGETTEGADERPHIEQVEISNSSQNPAGKETAISSLNDVDSEAMRFLPDSLCSMGSENQPESHHESEGSPPKARNLESESTDLELDNGIANDRATRKDIKPIYACDGEKLSEAEEPLKRTGALESTYGSAQEEGQASTANWDITHLGKVYVEFSREEAACQAAHTLHGRAFDGRKVAVCYFPLRLYQKKFNNGTGARTVREKEALALAVQGHFKD